MFISVEVSISGEVIATHRLAVSFVGTSHGYVRSEGGDMVITSSELVPLLKGERVLIACDEGIYWYATQTA